MEMYSRHSKLLGQAKFDKIQKSTVMVAGAGGLGCTVLNLLARIGVGTIHFFEYAEIDLPDMNRQILYTLQDIGKAKCATASARLKDINPNIRIIGHEEKITFKTIIPPNIDLVFDCLDSFTSRYILDDKLYPNKIPMIHAGVSQYFGQLTTIVPGITKSLRETITVDAKKFDTGIAKEISSSTAICVASIQVSEGIKYLAGDRKNLLTNKILSVDLHSNSFDTIQLA
jgi:molybdopterin/thiamine biosynthesis adenylyltransferase